MNIESYRAAEPNPDHHLLRKSRGNSLFDYLLDGHLIGIFNSLIHPLPPVFFTTYYSPTCLPNLPTSVLS